jgi:hypothetical protein
MRDRSLIYIGLLVFLVLITLPFTYDLVAGKTAEGPELQLPENEENCVAPIDYMKSSHMQLLIDWREELVRNNNRVFTAYDGRSYTIGLTETCISECHTSKADFCDRCHDYAGVSEPYCWDCHVDPEQIERSEQ